MVITIPLYEIRNKLLKYYIYCV